MDTAHHHDHKNCSSVEKEKEELAKNIQKGITDLPLEQKARLVAINYYLNQKKQLDDELEVKMKELTLLYEQKSQPLLAEQSKIITGERLPEETEVKELEVHLKDDEKAQKETVLKSTVALPKYWFKCLMNCSMLKNEIFEKDEEALEKLTKITYNPIKTGVLEIKFEFSDNEYFTNTTLTKTIHTQSPDDEPKSSEGTTIQWKEGKNLTKKKVKKTQKNKKTGAKRVVEKEVDDESFFNFFNTVESLGEEKADDEDEDAQKQEDRLNIDYDIARTLVDEIIPYSLEYYLNVKVEDDEDFDDEEDIDELDEEEDEVEDIPKVIFLFFLLSFLLFSKKQPQPLFGIHQMEFSKPEQLLIKYITKLRIFQIFKSLTKTEDPLGQI
jgi:nucleosome assembly protein 1-like 1